MTKKKANGKPQRKVRKKLTLKEKRKQFLAKKETLRRNVAHAQRELENGLLKRTLAKTLALYLVRNVDVPLNRLVKDLHEIEAEAGKFVGAMYRSSKKSGPRINTEGALANALPFITMRNSDSTSGSKSKKKPGIRATKST